MDTTKEVLIKGMVCLRCVQAIKDKMNHIGFEITSIYLGKVVFNKTLNTEDIDKIKVSLTELGFDLLEDRNHKILEQIKSAIHELVELNGQTEKNTILSEHLCAKLDKNYDFLSYFFRIHEGMTLEKFYIQSRLDKVKELLVYSNLTMSEISYRTGFSSPHHLSNQFKTSVGQSPSEFRNTHNRNKISRN